jgi:hypothetical protein
MGKLVLAVLVAAAGCLVPRTPQLEPFVVEVRPATGERVVLHVDGGDNLRLRANAVGLRTDGRRLVELVAPGTLEITGGEGELQLRSADPNAGFALGFKREAVGLHQELEARGRHASIRVRRGQVTIHGENMTMREVRSP